MNLTETKKVEKAISTAYGIENYTIERKPFTSSSKKQYRITVVPKQDRQTFFATEIIGIVNALHCINYITFSKANNQIELHII